MNYNDFLRAVSKKEVTGAYILHGQEEFTKNRAIEKLTELLNPNMRAVNLQSYEKTGAEELINACETMPFFDRLRLIIVQTVPDGDEARRILDFLDTMPESTLLIFLIRGKYEQSPSRAKKTQGSAEKTERSKVNFFSELEKTDRCVEFTVLTRTELVKWVCREVKNSGCTILPEVADAFIQRVGNDLTYVSNELKKAIDYVGYGSGNAVSIDAIGACVSVKTEYRVFDMMDAFILGKPGEGLTALNTMIKDGTEIGAVSGYISGRLKLMLSARLLIDDGVPRTAAVRQLGGNEYATGKAFDAAKHFSADALRAAVIEFSTQRYNLVNGIMSEQDALELAIFKHLVREKKR